MRIVRRERNQYIFASELTKRQRSHSFRNAVLLIVPILIVSLWVLNITVSRRVVLEELKLTVLDLPDDLENYSILHLSDLHGARYGENQKAIAAEPLLELITLMPEDTPKFLIPGDTDGPVIESRAHSSLSVYTDWAEELMAAGVQILDRPVLITREKGRIWFIPEELYALDLAGTRNVFRKQVEDLNSRSAKLTADDAAMIRALEYEIERIDAMLEIRKEFLSTDMQVVLTHTPLSEEYLEDLIAWTSKEEPFSIRYARLILAGHYNGGQWRIPFVGAVYVPELGWFPEDEEVRGLSYLQGIPQYISPGLGSDPHYEHQPGRIFNSPTITKIILTRKAN